VIDVGEGRFRVTWDWGNERGNLVGNGGIQNLGGGKKVPRKCPG
jgi:hypothetical protein